MIKFLFRFFPLCLVLCCSLASQPAIAANPAFAGLVSTTSVRGIPGEFERQEALLLAWDESDEPAQETQIDIVRAIWKSVPIVILVSSAEDQEQAAGLMLQAGIPQHAVRFVRVALDTVWIRDYGPFSIRRASGKLALVNTEYERTERPNDDDVPVSVAPLLKMPTIDTPLRMEGGNLLSNGAGLLITTSKFLDDNMARGFEQAELERQLRTAFRADETLILEPLLGEPTGHVDMFATFTASNCVIVGKCSAQVDPINAGILNRNAQRLSQIITPSGPMKVIRIPMPKSDIDLWRTYTNVIYANGTVLVPFYPGYDRRNRWRAVNAFRKALPGWKVVGIDCNAIIESGGALHCLSMNLGRIAELPETTPLDGRPDPFRQVPLVQQDEIIADANLNEAEWSEQDEAADVWNLPKFLPDQGSFPLAKRERSNTASQRSDVWRLDEKPQAFRLPANRRDESPHWQRYRSSPKRLRDFDRKERISIIGRD